MGRRSGIAPKHCVFTNAGGSVFVEPFADCIVLVNGQPVTGRTRIQRADRICIGFSILYILMDPKDDKRSSSLYVDKRGMRSTQMSPSTKRVGRRTVVYARNTPRNRKRAPHMHRCCVVPGADPLKYFQASLEVARTLAVPSLSAETSKDGAEAASLTPSPMARGNESRSPHGWSPRKSPSRRSSPSRSRYGASTPSNRQKLPKPSVAKETLALRFANAVRLAEDATRALQRIRGVTSFIFRAVISVHDDEKNPIHSTLLATKHAPPQKQSNSLQRQIPSFRAAPSSTSSQWDSYDVWIEGLYREGGFEENEAPLNARNSGSRLFMVHLVEFEAIYHRLEHLELEFNAAQKYESEHALRAKLRNGERRATTTRLLHLGLHNDDKNMLLKTPLFTKDATVADNVLFEQLGALCPPLPFLLAHPQLVAEQKKRVKVQDRLKEQVAKGNMAKENLQEQIIKLKTAISNHKETEALHIRMAVSFEFTRSCIDNALNAQKIKGQMETKIREYEGSLRRANDRVIRLSKHYDKVKLDHAALKEYRHGSKRIVFSDAS